MDKEAEKNKIAKRLTELHEEEQHLVIDAPLDPVKTWTEIEKRKKEIQDEREKLRGQLRELSARG